MKQLWLDTSKMEDSELVNLIHELNNEMEKRLRAYRGLKGQCEAASLQVRSWSTQHHRNMCAATEKY